MLMEDLSPTKMATTRTEFEKLCVMNCTTVDELEVEEPYKSRLETLIAEYRPKEDITTTIENRAEGRHASESPSPETSSEREKHIA